MSANSTTRITLDKALRAKGQGNTDWARLARTEELDGAAGDFDWSTAVIVEPAPKTAVSLRLDPEVVTFFKRGGKGYQTRINAVLRSYVAAKRTRE